MKKVAVVFNGGTITMKIDERLQAAVPSLSSDEIMSKVTGIEGFAEIETYTFSNMPSPHMTPDKMLELSKLETERTALTTEYDSVKKVISDNIERTFGIFS